MEFVKNKRTHLKHDMLTFKWHKNELLFNIGGIILNIAIVDDSPNDREQLANEIKRYAKENTMLVRIIAYKNGEEFLENTQLSSLDVVFLDIYLGDQNGMDVAYKIRKVSDTCQIVFITSSAAFAVQSYKVRAFYYIVKPYTYFDIRHVMDILDKNLQKSSRYINIKEGREWRIVLLSDILYADYGNHYVQIHTVDAIISTYMKFSEIEKKLLIYSEFLNCYRCIVINMDKIQKVEGLFFLLCNGEYIPINRKRIKEIKTQYRDYIFGIIEEDTTDDEGQ